MPSFGASTNQSRKMQNRNQICRTTTTTAGTESKSGSVLGYRHRRLKAACSKIPAFVAQLSTRYYRSQPLWLDCAFIVPLLCPALCFCARIALSSEQVAPFRSNSPPHDLHASHISPARLIVIKPFERNIWSITWKGIIAPFVSSGRRRPATKVIRWTFAHYF